MAVVRSGSAKIVRTIANVHFRAGSEDLKPVRIESAFTELARCRNRQSL